MISKIWRRLISTEESVSTLWSDFNVLQNRASGIPNGVIVMWSGTIADIPSNWALCDGTNGTPNLMDRFIRAAGANYAVGAIGGSSWHSHTVAIGTTTLTVNQMPAHAHYPVHTFRDASQLPVSTVALVPTSSSSLGGTMTTVVVDTATTTTGGGASHTHSGTADTANNVPAFYALAYIMKLADL